MPPLERVRRIAWRQHGRTAGERAIPEETAISFTYNGGSYAVMMATPQDLEDFALGFSLTEGIVASRRTRSNGWRLSKKTRHRVAHVAHRAARRGVWRAPPRPRRPDRLRACGIESLAEAMRTPRPVAKQRDVPARRRSCARSTRCRRRRR